MSDNKAEGTSANMGTQRGILSREKYWEEADAAEKIERLRDEVSRLCIVVTEQAEMIVKLAGHRHGTEGALLVMLDDALRNRERPIGLFAHDNRMPHRIRTEQERR